MKRPLNAVLRSVAKFQMRSLEISLQGKLDTIPYVTDEATLACMRTSIRQLQIDLAKARSRYQSFLPAGERFIWEVA